MAEINQEQQKVRLPTLLPALKYHVILSSSQFLNTSDDTGILKAKNAFTHLIGGSQVSHKVICVLGRSACTKIGNSDWKF